MPRPMIPAPSTEIRSITMGSPFSQGHRSFRGAAGQGCPRGPDSAILPAMPAPERHPWTSELERLDALAAADYAAACPPGLAGRLGIAAERQGTVDLVLA